MRELFVYYRVPAIGAEAAGLAVCTTQADLMRQHPGLIARLLRRLETTDGTQTWMETYAFAAGHAPEGIDLELQATIDTRVSAVLPRLDGPRHTEVFIACAS